MTSPDLIAVTDLAGLLRGALDVETTADGLVPHRLPATVRLRLPDDQFRMAESQPSGVRLAFRTAATVLELEARRTKVVYVGAPERPDGVYDLRVDGRLVDQQSIGGGHRRVIDMMAGTTVVEPGHTGTCRFADLPAGTKDVEIWLPHTEATELVALRGDAPIEPVPQTGRRTWLHHGSSISHGSNAASPSTTWAALAAAAGDVELVNLGFGGSALLDPFVARTMRDTPADLISVKIGINLVNLDLMRLRAFGPAVHGFLDTIRDGHPDTPLLVVSPILCPIHEDTPGPGAPDLDGETVRFIALGDPAERAQGKLTLTVIREELARIVEQRAADDPHLTYLDGRELYGEADHAELPLPDALHPDAATHRLIGRRFAETAFEPDGPFAPDRD